MEDLVITSRSTYLALSHDPDAKIHTGLHKARLPGNTDGRLEDKSTDPRDLLKPNFSAKLANEHYLRSETANDVYTADPRYSIFQVVNLNFASWSQLNNKLSRSLRELAYRSIIETSDIIYRERIDAESSALLVLGRLYKKVEPHGI